MLFSAKRSIMCDDSIRMNEGVHSSGLQAVWEKKNWMDDAEERMKESVHFLLMSIQGYTMSVTEGSFWNKSKAVVWSFAESSLILFWMIYMDGGCQWRENAKFFMKSFSYTRFVEPEEQIYPTASMVR